ncbi:MAG TPA: D-glycero-beta-D-manno-heptose 1-phosphate adenylyltransferase [Actinomycetota bacterium]|nr:D-glycero-beta-D-manno-heptose 1-phosphate adenylyltransferase [Actinomycetota bacterium]
MSRELGRLLERISGLRVLVVGEAILDAYLRGSVRRLSREAPVPILDVTEEVHVPGGAGNAAVNAAALGGEVRFLSVVGADHGAVRLRRALEERGVGVGGLVEEEGRGTLVKARLVADAQVLVRFDRGTIGPIAAVSEERLVRGLRQAVRSTDVVIVSDYGYGVLSDAVLAALAAVRRSHACPLIVDAKDLRRYRMVGPDAVKPNFTEALSVLRARGRPGRGEREAFLLRRGPRLLEAVGARIAAVTLDADGAMVFEWGRQPHRTYARPRPDWRAVGAGDTFTAAFALALAAGAEAPMAGELASAAAALVVDKAGTAACRAEELRASLSAAPRALQSPGELADHVARYREEGRRIVFTNGCFDLLHRGHITYLNRAKALGDVLIVALNGDDSVRRLKGPGRPINPLEDRAEVLAALSCIDHIVAFHEDAPFELIRAIRPDVYVKGGDYARERLPEAALVEALGGRVEILPYVEDRSTTGLIDRIRAASPAPAS